MLNNDVKVKVTNRSRGTLGYSIPDLGLRRDFAAGETKEITAEEVRKLSYISGGLTLLKSYLVVHSPLLIKEIFSDEEIEPEYYYTAEKVKEMLTTASQDEFLDMLDFAPDGVKELIQKIAVEIRLDSATKRQAIQEKLGFNVDKAIEIKQEFEKNNTTQTHAQRRVKVSTEEAKEETPATPAPKRRVIIN